MCKDTQVSANIQMDTFKKSMFVKNSHTRRRHMPTQAHIQPSPKRLLRHIRSSTHEIPIHTILRKKTHTLAKFRHIRILIDHTPTPTHSPTCHPVTCGSPPNNTPQTAQPSHRRQKKVCESSTHTPITTARPSETDSSEGSRSCSTIGLQKPRP